MNSNYDVVMYFYWAPCQVVHKYLSFHKKLQKFCNVLTIIGEGEFGITKEQFNYFDDKYKTNVILKPMAEALKVLEDVDYKIGIFSSNGRKGYINPDLTTPPPLGTKHPNLGKDIAIAKEKGALTIQISEMINDFYYAGADIASLVSPTMHQMHINPGWIGTYHRYQWRPYDANPEPKYIYSNCLLWDNVEDCIPYMSRDAFCNKYKLDKDKEILLYLPSACNTVTKGSAKEAYIKGCQLDNVIVKLHPKEYFRTAAERYDNKWSYEICGIKAVRVLDPLDTHWCHKYADLAMSNQTSTSIEMPLYNTPFLYIQPPSFPWHNLFLKLAHVVSLDNLSEFITNKKYKNKIENLDKFYDIVLADSKRKSADILSEQIKGLLNDNIR